MNTTSLHHLAYAMPSGSPQGRVSAQLSWCLTSSFAAKCLKIEEIFGLANRAVRGGQDPRGAPPT